MRVFSCLVLALGLAHSGLCQDLVSALSKYPELSSFSQLLSNLPGGVESILPSGLVPNSTERVTILAPNNAALLSFANSTGGPNIADLPADQLLAVLKYHVLAAKLTGKELTATESLIVPTLLRDQQYNNRSAGADLVNAYGPEAALGQVIFASKDPINAVKARRRQTVSVYLRGGNGRGAGLNAVDAQWALGYLQIVDSVLVPPQPCDVTIKGQDTLSSLDDALDKTDLYPALDTTPNVTCLAPTNNAFKSAGHPEDMLNKTDLTGALLFHTLPFPLYTPYIVSGMKVASLADGLDVTVVKVGEDIYFNDAKLISPNVLTNNGLIHVLDRIMTPDGKPPVSPSPTASPSPTGPSQSPKPDAANSLSGKVWVGLLTCFAAVALLL